MPEELIEGSWSTGIQAMLPSPEEKFLDSCFTAPPSIHLPTRPLKLRGRIELAFKIFSHNLVHLVESFRQELEITYPHVVQDDEEACLVA